MKYKKIEHGIQTAIIEYLAYNGFKVWKNNVGAIREGKRFVRFGQVGSSDIFAVKGGKFYSIECKTPSGQLTESQALWIEDIKLHGGVAFVARSLDDVIEKLK